MAHRMKSQEGTQHPIQRRGPTKGNAPEFFETLAKGLAQGLSRRQALRRMGGCWSARYSRHWAGRKKRMRSERTAPASVTNSGAIQTKSPTACLFVSSVGARAGMSVCIQPTAIRPIMPPAAF
jgi:hypothetical protein